jgi:hypothetical protein
MFLFMLCHGLPSAAVVAARSIIKISYVYLIIGLNLGFDFKIGRVKNTQVSHVLKQGGITNNINRFVYFCRSLFTRHHWVILGIRFDWHWEYTQCGLNVPGQRQ